MYFVVVACSVVAVLVVVCYLGVCWTGYILLFALCTCGRLSYGSRSCCFGVFLCVWCIVCWFLSLLCVSLFLLVRFLLCISLLLSFFVYSS